MLLLKAMYGLVRAPRAFYETFRKILTSANMGMLQSKVERPVPVLQAGWERKANGIDDYPCGRLRYSRQEIYGGRNHESDCQASKY